jgi:hypothetical protein
MEKQYVIEHFHHKAKSNLRMYEFVGCLQEKVVFVLLFWTSVLCNPIEVKKGTYGYF